MDLPIRYALISFLNARPLWWGLLKRPRPADTFQFTSPARCADLVAGGEADLALIPAIEIARIPDVVALPEICISSRTEVRSVLLVSKVPFEQIRAVALDPASRTSVTLARILLGERLGAAVYDEIKFDPVEPSALLGLEGHDAAVVIGDRALQFSRRPGSVAFQYDLASEWDALFGEPFVFALWAGRRSVVERRGDELVARLVESREYGLRNIETIAREASEELDLPFRELIAYFNELNYGFGEKEKAGLARFYALAAKYRLLDTKKDLSWVAGQKSITS
jgi:chorismate dehydratase